MKLRGECYSSAGRYWTLTFTEEEVKMLVSGLSMLKGPPTHYEDDVPQYAEQTLAADCLADELSKLLQEEI